MIKPLSILMISHHRRLKAHARPHAMAKHLTAQGHHVRLILTANTARLKTSHTDWDGVPVVEMPDLLWGRLRSGWDLWSLARRTAYLRHDPGPYDLVHCFETRPATIYPALRYRRAHALPIVSDWNDWWGRGGIIDEFRPAWYRAVMGPAETHFEEAFRSRLDGLTVISSALARRAEALGVKPERICHVPGGISTPIIEQSPEECRRLLGLSFPGPVLGFSSLDSHWDLEIVFQALAHVLREHPTVTLLITGRSGKHIHQLGQHFGLHDHLFLTGFVPLEQLPFYLGCADICVLPFPDTVYNRGRWPNKLGDYMSVGRPTVANPVGELRLIFAQHDVGLLADWDGEDFGRKIVTLLDNPALARRLGKNARQQARTCFSWDTQIPKLEQFYHHILTARKPN